jgi:hypothetical protein
MNDPGEVVMVYRNEDGREAAIQAERDRAAYEVWHFAPSRRVDDFIYISGIIVGRDPEAARRRTRSRHRCVLPSDI